MRRIVAVVLVVLGVAFEAAAAVTGRYDVALLRTRFTDTTDALYSVPELTLAGDELHQYFAQLSQGNLDLRVRVADVSVAHDWAHYHCEGCPSLIEDAAEAAGVAGFDFTDIEGILIVRAGCRENTGWTNGPAMLALPHVTGTFEQSYDVECGRSTLPSTVYWGGWAHELGHQLEDRDGRWALTHPSGYSSGYNLMDSCYPCGESSWSLAEESLINETGMAGYKLAFPGWLPASRFSVVSPATTPGATVVLSPISDDASTTTAPLGIKIPIATGRYYFLEMRRRMRSDAWPTIHDEGVQIMRIDETADPPATVMNSCETMPGGCNLTGTPPCDVATTVTAHPECWPFALWKNGMTFTDSTNGIAIRVGPEVGNGMAVTVLQTAATGAPDLYSTPWLTPPMNTYETIDIWVDSSCNGYESDGAALRYGRRADGTVIGNGDDPCANHENRIYATVRNIGSATANNVQVRFDVTDPLGVGITGPAGWRTVDTATSARFMELASLAAGATATVWVNWTPIIDLSTIDVGTTHFAHHSCVRIASPAVAGEVIGTNLDGDGEQENIDQFQVSAGRRSSGVPHMRSFRVTNPEQERTVTMNLQVDSGLPAGWRYEIVGPSKVTLQPRQSQEYVVKVIPDGDLPAGKSWHLRVSAWYMAPATLPRYVRTKRRELVRRQAGGIDFGAQAVDPTTIRMTVDVGQVITVKGSIDPKIAKAVVAIDYRRANGTTITHLVRTGDDGTFSDATVKPEEGQTFVRAFWQGTAKLSSAATKEVLAGSK